MMMVMVVSSSRVVVPRKSVERESQVLVEPASSSKSVSLWGRHKNETTFCDETKKKKRDEKRKGRRSKVFFNTAECLGFLFVFFVFFFLFLERREVFCVLSTTNSFLVSSVLHQTSLRKKSSSSSSWSSSSSMTTTTQTTTTKERQAIEVAKLEAELNALKVDAKKVRTSSLRARCSRMI